MSLPDTLNDFLEFWPMDDGAGTVAVGVNGIDMTVSGTARGVNGVDGLWCAGANLPGFAGKGAATFSPALNLLKNVGDAVTFAIEHWFGGFDKTVDPYPGVASGPSANTVGRVDGDSGFLYITSYGGVDPPPSDPATNTNCYSGSGVGSGNGVDVFRNAPPFTTWLGGGPYVLLMQIERTGASELTTQLYVANATNMGAATQAIAYAGDSQVFSVGAIDLEPPVTRRAAVWARKLTSGEMTDIFAQDTLLGLGESDGDPLLDVYGNSAISFRDPHSLSVSPRHIETDGGARNTRQVHERKTRIYELLIENATPAEMSRVQRALSISRGTMPVRWRHPTDDTPGTISDAPRWLITNAADIPISRTRSGSCGAITLKLQEV